MKVSFFVAGFFINPGPNSGPKIDLEDKSIGTAKAREDYYKINKPSLC